MCLKYVCIDMWHYNKLILILILILIDQTLHQFLTLLLIWTEFDFLPNCARFPLNICNGCDMPTEDVYSSRHLSLSHFGTCICSYAETNLSWLVSGLWVLNIPR